ncbi:MAG: hypothetical protein IPL61_17100 [Myxococcales bacterium]|nr:hypothetical protein [Myxococcales bacterium]
MLDALGRPRFTQVGLGDSYGGATVVSGLVERDELGRVVFEAAPFESSQNPFDPATMPVHPYGTTAVFDRRGRAVRSVEATGYNATATQTSVAGKVYVAESSISYSAGNAIVTSSGPDEHDPASARYGQRDQRVLTALGRELQRLRRDAGSVVLDKVEQDWDRLGRVVANRRYPTPSTTTGLVSWTTQYDSLGRVLRMQEPGMSAKEISYDEDGSALESWWMDGTKRRAARNRYDGFGRVTQLDLVSTPSGGPDVLEARDIFHYDEHSGTADQPAAGAAGLRGRLSWVENPTAGSVYYGYDPLGRQTSSVYKYAGVAGTTSQTVELTAGGVPVTLTLKTPETNDTLRYDYDSAWRTTQIKLGGAAVFQATSILPLGQYHAVTFGNGVSEFYTYDAFGRHEPLSATIMTASGAYMFEQRVRDAIGRVTTEYHSTPTGEPVRDGLRRARPGERARRPAGSNRASRPLPTTGSATC